MAVPVSILPSGMLLAAAFVVSGCGDGSAPETPAVASAAPASSATADPPKVDLVVGASMYGVHCAMCHGSEGRGDGPMAGALNPRPRGFVDEDWRFIDASTPESVRAGIARVIEKGLPESSMPGFGSKMDETQVQAVVEYVLELHEG